MENPMVDLIVIGFGPAGISTALYALRGGVSVLLLGKDGGALEKTEEIDNYYGFPQALRGGELVERGLEQAERLGAKLVRQEVVGITYAEGFEVHTATGKYTSHALVLATGASRQSVNIEGLNRLEGKGVSYCAMCDAFFYKGKDVAVLGCCDFAAHEVNDLLPVVRSVTLVTNEEPTTAEFPGQVKIIPAKISALVGTQSLEAILFEDGSRLEVSGLFVAIGVAGSGDLARKLGVSTQKNNIVVQADMSTGVPGLFAAGDCTGGLLQIAKAVGDGAKAGVAAVKYIRQRR